MTFQTPVINVGSVSPDGTCKVVSIENDHVVVAFGERNTTKLSFSDCQLLWGF